MGAYCRIFPIFFFVVSIVPHLTILFFVCGDQTLLDIALDRGFGLKAGQGTVSVVRLVVTVLGGPHKHLVMCFVIATLEKNVGAGRLY